ncbi:GNAT family N-acetyltransferase [Sporosarcina limicola]|uniref:Ribosomal protein S18 acetylase RimI-like enzyme n=1 Tax=Sporosarcina limicola TaxID=34101 RepID=A0A927MJB1_9BACL|nr:N-acetyltransferase [Sporosarcina limicola]MBE1554197.1 ribosomal protein S18 acetylase RimI-like enzyme [Sporosarcina limicola]
MTIIIEPPRNIKDLAAFLEKMNSVSIQHVGYCGEEKEEIYQTLLHEFSDLDLSQSFAVAYEGGSIVGALGLDIDKEDQSAEVWGPFISDEEHDTSIVDKLFENVISNSSIQFTRMDFFLNKENIKGKKFVLKHGGVEIGHHTVLIANRDELAEVDVNEIETYSPLYEKAFSRLHAAEFPSTYYSAQEILRRMNETNQLLIMRNDEEHIKGYVYVEAQPQHHTGSIEYIAVSNQSRKQGVGTKLVKFALAHLFSYDEIKEISLCVGNENESAINLYKAAGFKIEHELIHFKVISQGSIL